MYANTEKTHSLKWLITFISLLPTTIKMISNNNNQNYNWNNFLTLKSLKSYNLGNLRISMILKRSA